MGFLIFTLLIAFAIMSLKFNKLYVVQAAPMICFIDKAGRLVECHVGELTEAAFRQRIDDLLAS